MINYIHYTETSSTNSELRRLLSEEELPQFTLLYADYQTSGRGEGGNLWHSEAGKNLLFSFLLRPNGIKAVDAFDISIVVSVAIKKFLLNFIDDVSVKWPNDIYWRDKKICGILIENSIMGDCLDSSIIGVGLNVNQVDFPKSLPNPVSLSNVTAEQYSADYMLKGIAEQIVSEYNLYLSGEREGIKEYYHNSLFRLGTLSKFMSRGSVFEAVIRGVRPNGCLLLEDKSGNINSYAFKEVAYLL